MSHISFVTEPSERAILRWVFRAAGKGKYNNLFTFPLFPSGMYFICFNGDRLHRWLWKKPDLPTVAPLGAAWTIPEFKGITGVDTVTLLHDDENPPAVLQYAGLIGKAQNAATAAIVRDGYAFRENVISLANQIGFGKQKWMVFDLFNGVVSYQGTGISFEVDDVDGIDQPFAVDPKYLKDAVPYMPKKSKKPVPLFLAASDKTFLLDNGFQLAIIAQKIFVPEETDATDE